MAGGTDQAGMTPGAAALARRFTEAARGRPLSPAGQRLADDLAAAGRAPRPWPRTRRS